MRVNVTEPPKVSQERKAARHLSLGVRSRVCLVDDNGRKLNAKRAGGAKEASPALQGGVG